MRALVVLVPLLAGCQSLLGIEHPVGDRCSPFDVESCDITDTCDIFFTPTIAYLDCRPEGATPAGQMCNDPEECAGALTCFGGVCHAFCEVPGAACSAPDGACLIENYGYPLCDSACDVVGNIGCEAAQDCIYNQNGTIWVALCERRDFASEPVGLGAGCTDGEFCGIGLACEPESGTCAALCRPGGDLCEDPGLTCQDVLDALHGEALGFCLPPE